MARSWRVAGSLVSCALALSTFPGHVAAEATPAFIPADADWLTTVNYFRDMAALPPVSDDANLSNGAYKHSCYMLQNDIAHDEIPGRPGYTPEGDLAGNNGNVAVSSVAGTSARSHIELWMTGPFHAIGVLRPNLQRVGFGKCDNPSTPKWRSGATLDVLRGLGPSTPRTQPVLFPGNGSTTNLNRFIVETPDPRAYCGWSTSEPTGLPVIALMPEAVNGSVTTSVTGPGGPLQTCSLSRLNTDGTAQAILAADNAIVAIPRNPLVEGTYTVTVTSQARTVTWSFTVDPDAAFGTVTPPPTATPVGPSAGFQPVTPARVVDTRQNLGATGLEAGVTKTLQISGRGGVPGGASAVSGNFTIVGQVGGGYLTVWNCGAVRPVVSTVNFGSGEVAPNAATVPLDGSGRVCVFSTTATDLVVDVNGYFGTSGPAKFTPVTPVRLLDTRTVPCSTSCRLGAGQTVELQIGGSGSVPAGVSAVTLNVTSTDAGDLGYITVYACDGERPEVSNLNPTPGRVRPNLVVTPVSAQGKVCVFTLNDTDLVVDLTGYLSSGSLRRFTPSDPFRFVDTRDRARPEMNSGTGGNQLQAGTVMVVPIAGVRGVPTGAKAVSLNLTVTNANGPGYITAWPCGDRPTVSTANYEANNAVSNGAQLPLSADGSLCIFSLQTAHVIIDVNGWWS